MVERLIKKKGFFWKKLSLSLVFTCLLKTLWEKEKLLVMFSTYLENFLPFSSNWKLSFANSFSLEASKTCCLGKG